MRKLQIFPCNSSVLKEPLSVIARSHYIYRRATKPACRQAGNLIFRLLRPFGARNDESRRVSYNTDLLQIIYLIDTGKIADLRFPTYRFDNSAQGKFMLNIIFGQSKYYVDNLIENTKRGIREKLRLGEYPGFAPVGYLNDGKGKIFIDTATAPLIQKLYALCAEGHHTLDELKKLATASGLVSKRYKRPLVVSNVHRILTNAFYYGVFFYKGELFPGAHQPIITKELFDKVQEVLKFRSKPTLYKNHYFAFRGLIRCGECGCVITPERQKGHAYYHCTKRKGECSQKGFVREEKLALMISEAIKKASLDDKSYNSMMNELEHEKRLLKAEAVHDTITVEAKIREIDEQLSRLLDLFVEGAISADEYKEKKASLINKKIALGDKAQAIFSPDGLVMDKKTHHIENPVSGTSDGKWLEPMRDFLTLAHQASYVASAGTPEELADFFKKICSNRKVANATLYVSYSSGFKILAETEKEQLGSQSGRETKHPSAYGSISYSVLSPQEKAP
jgi:site-specific DNA recombinase